MKRFWLWPLLALITSCGFHLRGMLDMPSWLNNVAIVVKEVNPALVPLLKDQLQAFKIKIISDPAAANYRLILEKDTSTQHINSVSASTAPRQYQILYDVQFSLIDNKGKIIMPSTHVVITRELTINNDRILGSNYEERMLYNEMRRDAAMQIMNRLSRVEFIK